MTTMLQGSDLLEKVSLMGSVSRSELVRSCGYNRLGPDGREHLCYSQFYKALLAAKGVTFHPGAGAGPERSREGRRLSFRSHVHFNGNLMVGKAYTDLLDLQPGDSFEIKVEGQGFRLIPR
jgi:hypothetical protein